MSMALTTKHVQTPFPEDVLRWLVKNQTKIGNKVVRDFVRGYGTCLCERSEQETTVLPGGGIALARWETDNGSSYGYRPAEVDFHLRKLSDLFYSVMAYAYRRTTGRLNTNEKVLMQAAFLAEEILCGFSSCLGFYVLDCYFKTTMHERDKTWFMTLGNLNAEMSDIGIWQPAPGVVSERIAGILASPAQATEPYYNTCYLQYIKQDNHATTNKGYQQPQVPDVQVSAKWPWGTAQEEIWGHGYRYGYLYGDSAGYERGYQRGWSNGKQELQNYLTKDIGVAVIEAERKRLVSFVIALRQTVHMLSIDPAVLDGGWEEIAVGQDLTNEHNADGA